MANYTPTSKDIADMSNYLLASGLNQTELNRFMTQLNNERVPVRYDALNANQLGSITPGTDVVFVQGGGSITLTNSPPTVANDLNALIFNTNSAVNLQLPTLFGGTVVFGGGNDVVTTRGSKALQITAGAGNDTVTTSNGSDTIDAGEGNDVINAGNGSNAVRAGEGNNRVITGTGADTVTAGAGDDTISTGAGNDLISAGDGNNSIDAGAGNNTVITGTGKDTVTTGTGHDSINSGAGDDSINSGSGNDSVNAGAGNDSINTGAGHDSVTAGAGNDTINTGVGNDSVVISNDIGNNIITIDGGAGIDKLFLSDLNAQVSSVQAIGRNGLVIGLTDHTTLHVSNVETFAVDFNHNGVIDGASETVTLTGLLNHNFI
ncbi:calcium-binding protein [Crenothrix polyspora]|uniref:Hemolysin-type calcium-binding region n=1 Tax=Crenothrix polyspora TaxID=360316 RepID=A0A1R4GYF2_9GAMM|nr:calcium-binding protein [Crenothrix polyspora]SJM88998.1 hypothetical protein CRENPOLYSF1_10022 [Crenothrix polyspora]